MSSLTEVVKHLQTQNQTLEDVAASVKSMLAEDIKARLAEERSAGDREEARRKAERDRQRANQGRVSSSKSSSPKTFSGGVAEGLGLNQIMGVIGSVFGGLTGAGLGAALGLAAGRGIKYGIAAIALTKLAQEAIDYVFDNLDLDMDESTKDSLKSGTSTAINATLAMRFLGFKGRTSIGAGIGAAIGTQFGDEIADAIMAATDKEIINVPNIFGEGDIPINLKDPKIQDGIGMFAGSMAGAVMMGLAMNPKFLAAATAVAVSLGITKLIAARQLERSMNFLRSGDTELVGEGEDGVVTKEQMEQYEAGTLDPQTTGLIVGTLQAALEKDRALYKSKLKSGAKPDGRLMMELEGKIFQYEQLLNNRRFISDEEAYKIMQRRRGFLNRFGGQDDISRSDYVRGLVDEMKMKYFNSLDETAGGAGIFPDMSAYKPDYAGNIAAAKEAERVKQLQELVMANITDLYGKQYGPYMEGFRVAAAEQIAAAQATKEAAAVLSSFSRTGGKPGAGMGMLMQFNPSYDHNYNRIEYGIAGSGSNITSTITSAR